MRLSDARAAARELKVQFPHGVLHVTYRPPSYTLEQADALANASQRDVRKAAEIISQLLEAWDLTHDDDTPIALDPESIARFVPSDILGEIAKAIREDQSPGEAGASSVAG
jgi:hypothetical protein